MEQSSSGSLLGSTGGGRAGKTVLQMWREHGYVASPSCPHCRTPEKVFISILLGQVTQVMAQGERRTHTGEQCLLSRSFHHWLRSTGMSLGDDLLWFPSLLCPFEECSWGLSSPL